MGTGQVASTVTLTLQAALKVDRQNMLVFHLVSLSQVMLARDKFWQPQWLYLAPAHNMHIIHAETLDQT